jgi:hypothetical protein
MATAGFIEDLDQELRPQEVCGQLLDGRVQLLI